MSGKLMKSTIAVSGMTLLSRIFGFIRDIVAANLFGASSQYDAFLIAFRIPNFLRSLFAEGAFTQAFVPLLADKNIKDSANQKEFINHVAGCLALISAILCLLGMIFAPFIIKIFAPGFAPNDDRTLLASQILRIVFPYLFFITMAALAASILNINKKFAASAFTPVLLNLAMIFSAIFVSGLFSEPIFGLAIGVFLGGLLQLIWQFYFLSRIDFLPKIKPVFTDPDVKKLISFMVPAILGVSLVQINNLISSLFASFLVVGSVSWLYYADRLMQFPLGILGIAIATVVMPSLAINFSTEANKDYRTNLQWAIKVALLLSLPAAVGIYSLSLPLISTLFNYGKFTELDVINSSSALSIYSFGIVAFILLKIFGVAFYSRKDIKTPVKVTMVTIILNILLSYSLMQFFAHTGIVMASVFSASINSIILFVILLKRNLVLLSKDLFIFLLKLLIATILMFSFLSAFKGDQSFWLTASSLDKIIKLFSLILIGKIIFFFSLWIQGLQIKQLIK